jgi:hypothetical protein
MLLGSDGAPVRWWRHGPNRPRVALSMDGSRKLRVDDALGEQFAVGGKLFALYLCRALGLNVLAINLEGTELHIDDHSESR